MDYHYPSASGSEPRPSITDDNASPRLGGRKNAGKLNKKKQKKLSKQPHVVVRGGGLGPDMLLERYVEDLPAATRGRDLGEVTQGLRRALMSDDEHTISSTETGDGSAAPLPTSDLAASSVAPAATSMPDLSFGDVKAEVRTDPTVLQRAQLAVLQQQRQQQHLQPNLTHQRHANAAAHESNDDEDEDDADEGDDDDEERGHTSSSEDEDNDESQGPWGWSPQSRSKRTHPYLRKVCPTSLVRAGWLQSTFLWAALPRLIYSFLMLSAFVVLICYFVYVVGSHVVQQCGLAYGPFLTLGISSLLALIALSIWSLLILFPDLRLQISRFREIAMARLLAMLGRSNSVVWRRMPTRTPQSLKTLWETRRRSRSDAATELVTTGTSSSDPPRLVEDDEADALDNIASSSTSQRSRVEDEDDFAPPAASPCNALLNAIGCGPSHVYAAMHTQHFGEDDSSADEWSIVHRSRRCIKHACFMTCWLTVINVALAFLVLTSLVAYADLRDSTLPQLHGTMTLEGLTAPVTVERDPHGVIHITAANLHDLFFAQGVACAQDRLWQMELQRRVGAGRLSELVGSAGLDIDKEFRTLGIYAAAQNDVAMLASVYPTEYASVLAYVQGVNAYLRVTNTLPVEFLLLDHTPERWTPADLLVFTKLMSFDLSNNLFPELERLRLTSAQALSIQRISELWPDYIGPTILAQPFPTATPPSPLAARASSSRHWLETLGYSRLSRKSPPSTPLSNATGESLPASLSSSLWRSQLLKGLALPKRSRYGHHSLFGGADSAPSRGVKASNNWVIHGSRTSSGLPLLANDPHLGFHVPSVWLLMHLHVPNVYEAIGSTFAGVPGVIIGHNNNITWGVTNVGADIQDLYILEASPSAPNSYLWNNQSTAYVSRHEEIKIRDHDSYKLTVHETVYGPVISDIYSVPISQRVALRWVAVQPNDTTLNQAQNFTQFRAALSLYVTPAQNFIYADRAGNIGYQCPGVIPIRAPGHTGLYPVLSTDGFDWRGFIPFEQLPWTYNPPEGFIATANNKVVGPSYNYSLLGDPDWEPRYRAERIRQLIEAKPKHTRQDVEAIQNDVTSLMVTYLRPYLQLLKPESKRDRHWRSRLVKWDGNEHIHSKEALIFELWYIELTKLGATETGQQTWDEPQFILNSLELGDPSCTEAVGGNNDDTRDAQADCLEFAAQSLRRAITRAESLNRDHWGFYHQAVFNHDILAATEVGCFFDRRTAHGGDRWTVNVGPYDHETLLMSSGPGYRQVVDLATLDNSVFVQPIGQSGNLFSRHFDDLLSLWARGAYVPMKMRNYRVVDRLKLE